MPMVRVSNGGTTAFLVKQYDASYHTITIDMSAYSGEITICIAAAVGAAIHHVNLDTKSVTTYWKQLDSAFGCPCSVSSTKQLTLGITYSGGAYPVGIFIMSGTIN